MPAAEATVGEALRNCLDSSDSNRGKQESIDLLLESQIAIEAFPGWEDAVAATPHRDGVVNRPQPLRRNPAVATAINLRSELARQVAIAARIGVEGCSTS